MNLKRIIKEEIDDLDWIRKIKPVKPYSISSEPNLYISDSVVQMLNLPDGGLMYRGEKKLGNFSWIRNGIRYSFTASIYPTTNSNGETKWRVIGHSGDYGFGYPWMSKSRTLGKRARMQIFKQIIDRYNLNNIVYEH